MIFRRMVTDINGFSATQDKVASMTERSARACSPHGWTPHRVLDVPGKVLISGDVDNDGDLDVFIGQARTDVDNDASHGSDILLNNGDGTYSLGPVDSAARFMDYPSNPAGAGFVDFDRDGHLDLWVVHNEIARLCLHTRYAVERRWPGQLLKDVTAELGLTTQPWMRLSDINAASTLAGVGPLWHAISIAMVYPN